jgi:hypothetical protein
MEYKHFIKGQRYLFYHKAPYQDKCITFRANFVSVINTTLLVNSSETERTTNTIVSIPTDWIKKTERLEDIIGDTVLPSDILLLIDNFN